MHRDCQTDPSFSDSKIRDEEIQDLGPQYKGAHVSRTSFEDLGDEAASEDDNPFAANGSFSRERSLPEERGESNSEIDAGKDTLAREKLLRDSSFANEEVGSDDTDVDATESSDSDRLEDQSSKSSSPAPLQDDRATLRKMMADEQKSVAASLSAAAKSDVAKGRALKRQREGFDALLNTRIKLQKTLIASNSLASVDAPSEKMVLEERDAAIQRAEAAATKLWTSLTLLRTSLGDASPQKPSTNSSDPAKAPDSAEKWTQMQSQDSSQKSKHRTTLSKWSQRTNPVSTLRPQNRLTQAPPQQSLISVLDQSLTGDNLTRAIKKTQIARSCAPVQASTSTKHAIEDPNIYDDADFYTILLRELVDRRMTNSSSNGTIQPQPSAKTATTADLSTALLHSSLNKTQKVRKLVDTKASKGRKMRYTVHEKLQNFMAPDDRSSWGERQRSELFAGLLGRKVDLGEEDGSEDEEEAEEQAVVDDGARRRGTEMDVTMDREDDDELDGKGLRLFG